MRSCRQTAPLVAPAGRSPPIHRWFRPPSTRPRHATPSPFLPAAITAAPGSLPGVSTLINLPAVVIMLLITWVLSYGVRESARINNVMVAIKIGVVLLFIAVGVW
ncbi:putative amino acid permease YhdG [Pandoraea horticolens]|uniref:Putative amino acid permease YhdG n=1 Tax=Pandoraea horticolens TaxID=2508298 RepID=A0A5E4UDX3_9BURK|nr:putative amino acid permease YhdG [Pandoraea horticolens]